MPTRSVLKPQAESCIGKEFLLMFTCLKAAWRQTCACNINFHHLPLPSYTVLVACDSFFFFFPRITFLFWWYTLSMFWYAPQLLTWLFRQWSSTRWCGRWIRAGQVPGGGAKGCPGGSRCPTALRFPPWESLPGQFVAHPPPTWFWNSCRLRGLGESPPPSQVGRKLVKFYPSEF